MSTIKRTQKPLQTAEVNNKISDDHNIDTTAKASFVGRIIAVNNNCATIRCINKSYPLGTILYTYKKPIDLNNNQLPDLCTFQVSAILNSQDVNCIAFDDTRGLSRGLEVFFGAEEILVPKGKYALGRVIDSCGQFIDQLGDADLSEQDYNKINYPIVPIAHIKSHNSIIETGIKIIDFLCPIVLGSSVAISGGAGVGKTVTIMELINSFVNNGDDSRAVFVGSGERSREATELYEEMIRQNLIDLEGGGSKVSLAISQMCDSAARRQNIIDVGLNIANDLTKKNNVLLFVDNLFRLVQAHTECTNSLGQMISEGGYAADLTSFIGHIQDRIISDKNNKGKITSVQSVYLPSDDIYDPAVVAIIRVLYTIIFLDREIAAQGRFPAIDPLKSSSSGLSLKYCTQNHIDLAHEVKSIIHQKNQMMPIVQMFGEGHLSDEMQSILKKARLLENFFTQPMFAAQHFMGQPGQRVSLQDTIRGVEKICSGDLNHIDPKDLYMIGRLPNELY